MRTWIALVVVAFAGGASALGRGGTDTGNGGDSVALQFQTYAELIVTTFQQDDSARAILPELNVPAFAAIVLATKVTSQDHVFLNRQEKDALNFPSEHRIEVGRLRWLKSKDSRALIALVLHEYLELMQMENEQYQLSRRFRLWLDTHPLQDKDADDGSRLAECDDQVDGVWRIGRSGKGCDSSEYLPDSASYRVYHDFIYYEGGDDVAETARYMKKMVALTNEAAEVYLRGRRPASSTEILAWQRVVAALVQSESLWSHYRLAADHRLKISRGDGGHGYGLTQIDDRAWSRELPAMTDLVRNLHLSMDVLFAHWEKAAQAPCVSAATNWRDRSRSAYSSFNGGPAQICRWAGGSAFKQTDQTFAAHYDGQVWLTYVDDLSAKSGLNLPCLFAKPASQCLK